MGALTRALAVEECLASNQVNVGPPGTGRVMPAPYPVLDLIEQFAAKDKGMMRNLLHNIRVPSNFLVVSATSSRQTFQPINQIRLATHQAARSISSWA